MDAFVVRQIGILENEVGRLRRELQTHRHHRDPQWDEWTRDYDRAGRAVYTDHFRSGTIPTGFSWISDGDFNGAPAALDYDWKDTYLVATSNDTPHFLADAITVYSGQNFYARIRTGATTEFGVRLDDGSDDNYAEIILDPDGLGGYNVDFRYRAGGGAVTDVTGPYYAATEFCIARLAYSAQSATVSGSTLSEDGMSVNITGAGTGVIAWTPARVGLKVQVNGGNYAACDWFYNTFT